MDIREFGPDDLEAVRHYVDVTNATRAVDSPWVHPMTLREAGGYLRWAWDKEPPVAFLATHQHQPVGFAEYSTSEWDNQHLAWLWIAVHPDHRGSGHGSALMSAMLERARAEGRTSVGINGWDSEGTVAFAKRHGFELKSQDINRRQTLAEVDWATVERLHAEAAAAAAPYDLVRRTGPTPEDELDALAALTAAINDAPTDDLDIEDEVYSAQRVRDYEEAQAMSGMLLHRVIARHRDTGELAGHTDVAVDSERPHIGHQHDTAVARVHRGHRLGLLLKTDMMLWLHEAQPQLATIDTWNAESNDHMIGVNEQIGYRILGRSLSFQRDL